MLLKGRSRPAGRNSGTSPIGGSSRPFAEGSGSVGLSWPLIRTGVEMLEGRKDLAVIWDIRVSPGFRRQGLGKVLFLASETWARARGCRWLKVETQNINVPACRFYAKQGCILGSIDTFAYPGFPDETQLLWYKDLSE